MYFYDPILGKPAPINLFNRVGFNEYSFAYDIPFGVPINSDDYERLSSLYPIHLTKGTTVLYVRDTQGEHFPRIKHVIGNVIFEQFLINTLNPESPDVQRVGVIHTNLVLVDDEIKLGLVDEDILYETMPIPKPGFIYVFRVEGRFVL